MNLIVICIDSLRQDHVGHYHGGTGPKADRHREVAIAGYFGGADRALRDGRWSFVRRPEGEPDELYDLAADPRERHNVIDRHPDQARRLVRLVSPALLARPLRRVKGIQGRYEMASGAVD